MDETSKRLGLRLSAKSLAGLVQVDTLPNTELIRIRVNSGNPELSAAIANTLGELLIEQGQKVYTGEGKDVRQVLLDQLAAVDRQLSQDRINLALARDVTPESPEASNLAAKIRAEETTYSMLLSQYEKARLEAVLRANSISVIEPATVPVRPSKPDLKMNLALAGALGLICGIGLAFLAENLMPMIRSEAFLTHLTDLELLGRIPKSRRRRNAHVRAVSVAHVDYSASAVEPYLALGAGILRRARPAPRTIVVSSAEPGAGKTTTAANLGVAFAQTGRRVLLVDGDQRRPAMHTVFDLPLAPGLADAVPDLDQLQKLPRLTRTPGLRVLTAGSAASDPLAFWKGDRLSEIVESLVGQADIVIWDTPPVLAAVDVKLLAPFADLFLLVVAEDQTTKPQLEMAIEQLHQVGCDTPGLVYNKTKDEGYSHYRYYYRQRDPARATDKTGSVARRVAAASSGSAFGSGLSTDTVPIALGETRGEHEHY